MATPRRLSAQMQKRWAALLRLALDQADPCAGTESVDEDDTHLFGPVADPLW